MVYYYIYLKKYVLLFTKFCYTRLYMTNNERVLEQEKQERIRELKKEDKETEEETRKFIQFLNEPDEVFEREQALWPDSLKRKVDIEMDVDRFLKKPIYFDDNNS